jgi:hypothetical protein
MRQAWFFAVVGAMMLLCASQASVCFAVGMADVPPNPRENVSTALAEAIDLLEAKRYTTLIKRFVPPDQLKRLMDEKSLEEVTIHFEAQADEVLKAFRALERATPVFSRDGREATFRTTESVVHQKLTFQRIGRYWYIKD